jgi:hypothetical protein
MAISILPKRYGQRAPVAAIDIHVPATESPTGKAIRFRRRYKFTNEIKLKALAFHIEAALRTTGIWEPEQSEPQERTAVTHPASKRGSLGEALRLAWECPDEGLSRTKYGHRTYKEAADCVRVLGSTLPCARVDDAALRFLREWFVRNGLTGCAAQKRLASLYRVLHFAERDGWIARRPAFERHRYFGNAVTPASALR